jgi:hydroxypyruvate isomerase
VNRAHHFAGHFLSQLRSLVGDGVFPNKDAAELLCQFAQLMLPYVDMTRADDATRQRTRRKNMRNTFARLVAGQLERIEDEGALSPGEAAAIRAAVAKAIQSADDRDCAVVCDDEPF